MYNDPEHSYPAQGEILFYDVERIVVSPNYVSQSFSQMAAHILTFDFGANFRLATFSPDRNYRKTNGRSAVTSSMLARLHQPARSNPDMS